MTILISVKIPILSLSVYSKCSRLSCKATKILIEPPNKRVAKFADQNELFFYDLLNQKVSKLKDHFFQIIFVCIFIFL